MSKIEEAEASTALHESGHAVIARILGVEVDYVRLNSVPKRIRAKKGGTCLGEVAFRLETKHPNKAVRLSAWKAKAQIECAGRIAQERVYPDTIGSYGGGSMCEFFDDMFGLEQAADNIVLLKKGVNELEDDECLYPDEEAASVALRKHFMKQTDILVGKNWSAIKQVAAALIRHRFLDQANIDAVIRRNRRRDVRRDREISLGMRVKHALRLPLK